MVDDEKRRTRKGEANEDVQNHMSFLQQSCERPKLEGTP